MPETLLSECDIDCSVHWQETDTNSDSVEGQAETVSSGALSRCLVDTDTAMRRDRTKVLPSVSSRGLWTPRRLSSPLSVRYEDNRVSGVVAAVRIGHSLRIGNDDVFQPVAVLHTVERCRQVFETNSIGNERVCLDPPIFE